MRLFDSTAFYVGLLFATFEDIQAFTVLLVFAVAGFANVFFCYNLTRGSGSDRLFGEESDNEGFNSFLYAYKLSLGDFDTEGIKGYHS